MGRAAFRQIDVERVIKACRKQGLAVDKMRPHVGVHGFTLLPPGSGDASDDAELDAELEAWRARGNG